LPMVYGIVKQSGGSVEIYSEPGQGTTVKVYVPRVDAAAIAVAPAGSAVLPETTRGWERILLVEDDAQLQELVATILAGRGYTVEVVKKVEELHEVVGRIPACDLLVTDVVMPKMNGPEVAKLVAQHWPGVKVLFVSGYTTNAIVHHGVLQQEFQFLQKPFTPTALAKKVREILDGTARTAAESG